MDDRGEAGFTIVELLVAAAIAVLAALLGLGACRCVAQLIAVTTDGAHTAAALDAEVALMHADAAGATAVYLPPADRGGAVNDGPNGAHEIDFFSRDDRGTVTGRRYVYDATAQTVTLTDFDGGGAQGVRDPATGAIDPTAAYAPLRGITTFTARTLAADALGSAANRYAGVAALLPLPVAAQTVAFGPPAPGLAGAVGGNAVVAISLGNAAATRTVHLMPGTVGAGFTTTAELVWHAIVYRVDQTHRSDLGVAQKSHVFIKGEVDVSYDGWKTGPQPWCHDISIFSDLDGKDPHANYMPSLPAEQAPALIAKCVKSGIPAPKPQPSTLPPSTDVR